MLSIVSMFSNFLVLDVFQTYSMVSHLRWQDSTICRALIGKNCTYVWNRHNQSWQSSVLQSCDGRRHRFHFLYDNVLSRQAMAVEFSGNQWLTLIRSAQVRFPSHLRISTWPPPSCTLYNTFLSHIVEQSPPHPPCHDGLVQHLYHLALIGLISPHIGHQGSNILNSTSFIFFIEAK